MARGTAGKRRKKAQGKSAPAGSKPAFALASGYRGNGRPPRRDFQRSGLFTEVSFTDPLGSLYGSLFPFNPDELVGKKGLEIFDKMRRDDQVHSALSIKKLGVLAPGWGIIAPDNGGDAPDMDGRIDFISSALRAIGQGSETTGSTFEYDLQEIMTALEYGYSLTEKIYRVIPDGPFAGKIGIKALKTRKPHSFDFRTDDHGNLLPDGIRQSTLSGAKDFPTGKFVIYTYNPEFDNPYGRSDLVNVYREWFSKDTIHKFWTISLERFGEPLADVEFDHKVGPEDQDEIEKVLKNLSSRNYFLHPEGVTLNLREPALRGVSAYREAITAWNLGIARGILIPKHIGLTEGGEVGTLAQAKENMRVFMIVLRALRQDIAVRVVQRQIVRPLMRLNFDPPEPEPVFQFNPITDEEAMELAASYIEAAEKGIVGTTRDDEAHLRRLWQFPGRPEEDEKAGGGESGAEGPNKPKDIPGAEEEPVEYDRDLAAAFLRADHIDASGGKHTHAEGPFDIMRPPDGEAETRFGFRAAASELNGIGEAAQDALVSELTAIKESTKAAIGRLYKPFPKPGDARRFSIPSAAVGRLRREIEKFTLSGFEAGRAQARRVVQKGKRRMANPTLLTPEAALRVFKERAFWVTGVLSDDLTNDVKGAINNALLTGATQAETEEQIARLFEKYARTPELAASVTGEAMEASRIETVVRTNLMTAYNQGALSEYREAAKDGLVEAVRFSAVLDARTTEICRSLDGKVLPIGHPQIGSITPPLHFNALPEGALVTTGRGLVPIETVRLRDRVLTHRNRWRPVYSTMSKPHDSRMLRLDFASGRILHVTEEHPILASVGWKAARNVKVGDVLFEHFHQAAGRSDVLLADPENFPSAAYEEPVPYKVMRLALGRAMTLSINFKDDKFTRKREVGHVGSDGVLEDIGHAGRVQQGAHGGFRPGWLPPEVCRHASGDPHSDVDVPGGVVPFHPLGVGLVDCAGLLGHAPGPMIGAALGFAGSGVKRGTFGLAPDFDAEPLAHAHECCLAATEAPLDGPHGLSVFPVPLPDDPGEHVRGEQFPLDVYRHQHSPWRAALVERISIVDYNGEVFNLGVEEDETYIADGVIVHNCRSILVPILVGDEWTASSQKEINRGLELADPKFVA